ncbi:hypothetical protein CSA56_18070 [candidate division KSB3 bacterium]|uniref:Uncharacterized protein n=1 Tax=candidate division KSB3 bacterium TaxID=2044937 RepID=A0A2G6K952_9BACT|nr:MAG: hypothetical protein CSA56_18070 [candidate division KSB3 bacterium]
MKSPIYTLNIPNATGQKFSIDVVKAVFEATQGQPWLVNAMTCEIVEEILHNDLLLPILPSNRIYGEVIVRTLNSRAQMTMRQQ